jgi:ribosomal protein S21
MLQVTRKDSKESVENLIRRFTRKVQQAGIVTSAKQAEFFEKPISKSERRQKAIVRRDRKAIKIKKIKLGQAPAPKER